MSPELLSGWTPSLLFAVMATVGAIRSTRRRAAINEALHELRRPLQALTLAAGPDAGDGPAELAAAALEQLERRVNGERPPLRSAPVDLGAVVVAAAARWSFAGRAVDAAGTGSRRTVVEGDRVALSQALDNLIANALEHGEPPVAVRVTMRAGWASVVVSDAGGGVRPRRARNPLARLSGRCRRGHGLVVARRTAAAHGGELELRRAGAGTAATLTLPLAGGVR